MRVAAFAPTFGAAPVVVWTAALRMTVWEAACAPVLFADSPKIVPVML